MLRKKEKKAALSKAVPGTENWKKLNAEVQQTKARLKELTSQSGQTKGALVYSLAKGNEENQPLVDKYIEMIDAIEKDLTALRESIGTPAAEAAPEPEAPADSVTIEFPTDAQPAAEEKKTCPQCGAPVSDDALFCNKCGAQL